MEKIQQALERARNKRESNSSTDVHPEQAINASSIVYTHTKSVSGNLLSQKKYRILSTMENSAYTDAFKILSTQVLYRLKEQDWNSVAITSVNADAGKTTTAINLGISIARELQYTVLLVDLNLRDSKLDNYFGVNSKLGVSDYLLDNIDLSDILIKIDEIDDLVILPGGTPVTNSSELLKSPKMNALAEELKGRYPNRIVIFDLPPVLNTADTLSFLPSVDCTLIVVEDDVTKEGELKQAIDLLSVANIIGTVLNKNIS